MIDQLEEVQMFLKVERIKVLLEMYANGDTFDRKSSLDEALAMCDQILMECIKNEIRESLAPASKM